MLYKICYKKVQEKQANKLSEFFSIPKGGSSQEQNENNQKQKFFDNTDKRKKNGQLLSWL